MKIEEAYEIIQRCPYYFTEEDMFEFRNTDKIIKRINREGYRVLINNILAMVWIEKWKTIPPQILLHDAALKNREDETCAMIWIKENKSLPPKELLHDPTIQDDIDRTCAMYWIIHVGTIPPPQLLYEPSIVNDKGDLCNVLDILSTIYATS